MQLNRYRLPRALIVAPALLLAAACSEEEALERDLGILDGRGGKESGTPDRGKTPDTQPPKVLKVAAVQYSATDFTAVSGCSDNICGLSHYIREAAKKGAHIVVTPEYVQLQTQAELAPAVGDSPATDSRWQEGTIIRSLAKLAVEVKAMVIFNLLTQEGSGSAAKLYNTLLAVDQDGKVKARHYKFQLFGSETGQLSVGSSVDASFFDTFAGKAGLLICADVQCIVTNMTVTTDCSSHARQMLYDFFGKKPKMVFFSAYWSVGPSNPTWWSLNVQKKIATDGKVWVVGANNTLGAGKGGGIWRPGGTVVQTVSDGTPSIVYGDITVN